MSAQNSSAASSLKSLFAGGVIFLSVVIGVIIYLYVLGAPSNFEGDNPANHPLPGNWLGVVYKGGIIVPINIALLIIVVTMSIERFITIGKAAGKKNTSSFVHQLRALMSNGDLDAAMSACQVQKGSLANVVHAGLNKYKQMQAEKTMDKEARTAAVKKELEEATSLELPMLSSNLVILSTIASIATLMGLLGTVIGMIKAFAALAQAGAPDAVALANGISEALINTALGIGISALAIIAYNFFNTKIDALTYGMDEASFTIVETFGSREK